MAVIKRFAMAVSLNGSFADMRMRLSTSLMVAEGILRSSDAFNRVDILVPWHALPYFDVTLINLGLRGSGIKMAHSSGENATAMDALPLKSLLALGRKSFHVDASSIPWSVTVRSAVAGA